MITDIVMLRSCLSLLFVVSVGCGEVNYSAPDTPSAPDAAPGTAPVVDAGSSTDATCTDTILIDEAAGCDFSAGSFEDTESITGGGISLTMMSERGSFTSRVLRGGAEETTWSSLSWTPDAPYSKPLPNQGAREEGYRRGHVDMADNVLLLHLDDLEAQPGLRLNDSSGRDNHPIIASTTGLGLVSQPGRFQGALRDSLDSHFYLDIEPDQDSDLDFDEGDFTWALWVSTSQDCTGNKVYMGVEGPGQVGLIHLWLGCMSGSENVCAAGSPAGRAGGFFTSAQGTGSNGEGFCGLRQINDGDWHHLALVKSGHAPSTLSLYVDGVLEDTASPTFDQPFRFTDTTQFTFGAFPSNLERYQAEATFDEVAIWQRALSADAIQSLYRRGALRLGFQVRVCDDAQCESAGPFGGPGGDPLSHYDEPLDALSPAATVPLSGWRGRYLQYKAILESDIAGESPVLRKVQLTAQ